MIMHDGIGTLIAFQFAPAIGGVVFKENAIKPFGLDGRGPINTTSLRNRAYVTKVPKVLIELTDITGVFQWDPEMYNQIDLFLINRNQQIRLLMPNGEIYMFYGWLDKFDPQEQKEGELPLANATIIASNMFNSNGVWFEVGPVREA